MRRPASFETLSSLLASAAPVWSSLLPESSLSASLSVALSVFLAAALSAFLAAILVVLSLWSLFSLLSFLAPLLPWSALAAFVLPAVFSGLAAFSLLSGALASFGAGGARLPSLRELAGATSERSAP